MTNAIETRLDNGIFYVDGKRAGSVESVCDAAGWLCGYTGRLDKSIMHVYANGALPVERKVEVNARNGVENVHDGLAAIEAALLDEWRRFLKLAEWRFLHRPARWRTNAANVLDALNMIHVEVLDAERRHCTPDEWQRLLENQ